MHDNGVIRDALGHRRSGKHGGGRIPARKGYEVADDRLEHEHLELALEAAKLGTWTWDQDTGKTLWDARLEAMHGMEPGSFGGTYDELVPNERIRYSDRFDDPNLPGEMTVTITLKSVSVGTAMNIVQEGIPDAIPVEQCYLGWQQSLELLGKLVEAEVKG